MSVEYRSGHGRPAFNPSGRLVARRERDYGGKLYRIGDEVPNEDLPHRTLAQLWDQGWIDTLAPEPPAADTKPGKRAGK